MEELCIGGGGLKGIAFLGALYELDKNGLITNVKKYSGTSIGGFLCILLIIGYTPKELIDIVFKLEFSNIKDIDVVCILTHMSLMRGDKFKEIVKKTIHEKENPNTTLIELYDKYKKELIITVVCIDTAKLEYISYKSDPDITIFKLACMTMCVPLILPPEIYNNKLYADGGILDNLPVKVLCSGTWCITSSIEGHVSETYDIYDYIIRITDIVYNNLQDIRLDNYPNVIKIQLKGIKNVDTDEKLMMINKGREAVREKLNDIDNYIKTQKSKDLSD